MKKVSCIAALVLSLHISHIRASDFEGFVNLFAGLGSAVSAGFSASGVLSQVSSSVSLTGVPMGFIFRSATFSDPNAIPRFVLDVTCAALSLSEYFKNEKNEKKHKAAMNVYGWGGSLYSLLQLAPMLPTNVSNPFFAARAVLDCAHLWLRGKRLGIHFN